MTRFWVAPDDGLAKDDVFARNKMNVCDLSTHMIAFGSCGRAATAVVIVTLEVLPPAEVCASVLARASILPRFSHDEPPLTGTHRLGPFAAVAHQDFGVQFCVPGTCRTLEQCTIMTAFAKPSRRGEVEIFIAKR